MSKANEPAFPCDGVVPTQVQTIGDHGTPVMITELRAVTWRGLTKREYFAIEMMKSQRMVYPSGDSGEVANDALKDADALTELLAETEKAK
jgi:hypothetical protein